MNASNDIHLDLLLLKGRPYWNLGLAWVNLFFLGGRWGRRREIEGVLVPFFKLCGWLEPKWDSIICLGSSQSYFEFVICALFKRKQMEENEAPIFRIYMQILLRLYDRPSIFISEQVYHLSITWERKIGERKHQHMEFMQSFVHDVILHMG